VGFDGLMVLKCVGNFIGVFFGAFALGSGMGCITAVVSFTSEAHF
jgi:sodium/hydrogen exchanger-like protein 6/7